MTDQDVRLKIYKREAGKGQARKLRLNKWIPAVVYGPGQASQSLTIREGDAIKYTRSDFENTILTLQSDDKSLNGLKVLKKDVAFHPVSRRPIHIDFFAPNMKETVRVNVEVKFEGKPAGETEDDGLFNALRREVEVECLPDEIPDHITLDVSELRMHETLHVSDLKVPGNLKLMTDESESLATVTEVAEEPEPATEGEITTEGEGATQESGGESSSEES